MKLFSKDRPDPAPKVSQKTVVKGSPKVGAEDKPRDRPSVLHNMGVYFRYMQAAAVLFLDKRLKRDPLVVDRLKHMRAQNEFVQLMLRNPSTAKSLPPGTEDQARYMAPALAALEKEIAKNPGVTMSRLAELQKNPPAPQTKLRTRPGPPTRGRGRY
jgi:hypothetical protein